MLQQVDPSLLQSVMPEAVSSGNKYRDFVNARIAMLEGATLQATNISDADKKAIEGKALTKLKELLTLKNDELEKKLKKAYKDTNKKLTDGKDHKGKTIPDAHKDFFKMVYDLDGFNRISMSNATSAENPMTASTVFSSSSASSTKKEGKKSSRKRSSTSSSSSSTDDSKSNTQQKDGLEKQLGEKSAVLDNIDTAEETRTISTAAATTSSSSANLDTDDLPGNPDDKKKATPFQDFVKAQVEHLNNALKSNETPDSTKDKIQGSTLPFFKDLEKVKDEKVLKGKLDYRYKSILQQIQDPTADSAFKAYLEFAYRVSRYQSISSIFVDVDLNAPDAKEPTHIISNTKPSTTNDFGNDTDDEDDIGTPVAQDKYRLIKYVGVGITAIALAATALYMCRNTEMGSKLITMVKELFNRSANTPQL